MAEPNHAGFHNELRLTAHESTLRIMICPPGVNCAAAHKAQFNSWSEARNHARSQIMRKAQVIPLEDRYG
ncbi:MAG: hypothetical protein II912_08395 [Clostridia bacterium]|nr:hypothetical protein [Clostridia bacterium]